MESFVETSEYIAVIFDNKGNIYKLLDLFHITKEGAINQAKNYNRKYRIFDDVDEAVRFIKEFRLEQTVIDLIKEIVTNDFKVELPDDVSEDTCIKDLGIDSLEAFNLLYSLEQEYRIRFSPKFLPITVGDLINEVDRLREIEKSNINTIAS